MAPHGSRRTARGSVARSAYLAHSLSQRKLLRDLADASQPRFGELVAQTKHASVNMYPITPAAARAEAIARAMTQKQWFHFCSSVEGGEKPPSLALGHPKKRLSYDVVFARRGHTARSPHGPSLAPVRKLLASLATGDV